MIGGEELFAVVTIRGSPGGQKPEDDLVRVGSRRIAHFREQGRVDAKLVIFKGRAGDVHGGLVELVRHGVAVLLDAFKGAIARPFPQLGELAEPTVGVGTVARRYARRNAGPLRRRFRQGFLKGFRVAGAQGLNEA